MEVVTGATRNAVWQEMLDVARLVRYYDRMARQRQQRHLGIRIVLFASATAGVASAIDALPEAVRIASGALIALLVAWDFLADYANKAAILGVIRGESSLSLGGLGRRWRRLRRWRWGRRRHRRKLRPAIRHGALPERPLRGTASARAH